MKPLSLLLLFLSGIFFVQPAYSGETNSVTELQQQVQKLKSENESLKQENQVLRKLLFEKGSPAQTTATQLQTTARDTTRVAPKPAAAEKGYWMTGSSGKRHNPSCRYYGSTKGRPCGPD